MEWGLTRISSRELSEWLAYEQVEGFVGSFSGDYHFARMMALIINFMRGKEETPVETQELMIWLPKEERDQALSDEEMFDLMWAEVHGEGE